MKSARISVNFSNIILLLKVNLVVEYYFKLVVPKNNTFHPTSFPSVFIHFINKANIKKFYT